MEITIRDYRGVERADIDLAPIALVAGRNEQGKSSLAEAVRAALCGLGVPIPGIPKKDAHLLVREGATEGFVKLTVDGVTASVVSWPKAEVSDSGGRGYASPFAAGLSRLTELNDRDRAQALAKYIDSEPTREDVEAAMADVGYGEKGLDRLWDAVSDQGWDASWKRAREHSATLKGRWEATTGEKYGSKKAETWVPAGLTDEFGDAEAIEKAISEKQQELDAAIAGEAVDEAELARLRKQASGQAQMQKDEVAAKKQHQKLYKAQQAILESKRPEIPKAAMRCPECEAPLTIVDSSLVPADSAPDEAAIEDAKKAGIEWDQRLKDATEAVKLAENEWRAITNKLHAAKEAQAEAEAIESKRSSNPASNKITATEARESLREAQDALKAITAKQAADKIHGDIQKNDAVIGILAPDGLRRRKLAAGLGVFNENLAGLCRAAGWPAIRLDNDLQVQYGTRPFWAASKSGQWRTSAVLQVLMAQTEGSVAVVIDEADILDKEGRNGLVHLLKVSGLHALICMTINKPDLVPDLEAAGIGKSYWIENGVAVGAGQ